MEELETQKTGILEGSREGGREGERGREGEGEGEGERVHVVCIYEREKYNRPHSIFILGGIMHVHVYRSWYKYIQ